MNSFIVFVIIYHCHYPNHRLPPTLLPNLLPTDRSRHLVQHLFDQRLTKINREGSVSLPELVTDHERAGTKIGYLIHHAIHTYPKIEILTRSSSGDVDIPVILTGLFGSSRILMAVYNETGK